MLLMLRQQDEGDAPMTIRNLTGSDFESTITSNDIVLVDFWAAWCGRRQLAEQSNTGQSNTGQSSTGQPSTEQSATEQSVTV
jgi:thiol-disulfide isomerase/thioredoxin